MPQIKMDQVEGLEDALDAVGSGGHVIEDEAGTDLTQRAHLQFVGADVTDDAANDRTNWAASRGGSASPR